MAKVTITIEDHGSGNVHIASDPDVPIITQAGKERRATMALKYAIVALSAMVAYSGQLEKEAKGLDGFVKTRLSH